MSRAIDRREAAALERQIHAAGRRIDMGRCWVWGFVAVLGITGAMLLFSLGYWDPGFFLSFLLFALLIAVAGFSLTAAYRARRRSQLRRRLACLSRGQQQRLLLPLTRAPLGDTRRLATSLARDLRLHPPEVVPASRPDGRGSEPGPSENEPVRP